MNELEDLAHFAEMRAGFEDTTAAYEAFIEALQDAAASLEAWWQDYYNQLPWYARLEVRIEMATGTILDRLIAYWDTHFTAKRLRA